MYILRHFDNTNEAEASVILFEEYLAVKYRNIKICVNQGDQNDFYFTLLGILTMVLNISLDDIQIIKNAKVDTTTIIQIIYFSHLFLDWNVMLK